MYREATRKLSNASILASPSRTEIPIASRHDPEIFFALFHTKTPRSPVAFAELSYRSIVYGDQDREAMSELIPGIKLPVNLDTPWHRELTGIILW